MQLLKKFGIEKKEFEKSESWNFIIVRKCKLESKLKESLLRKLRKKEILRNRESDLIIAKIAKVE